MYARIPIHDYHTMNEALPGLYLTETIRYLFDAGESIPRGVLRAYDIYRKAYRFMVGEGERDGAGTGVEEYGKLRRRCYDILCS
jgi:hypothetical protein